MKAPIKAAWVAAMRARTDTPARGQLRRGDCFCWEGLLCHVIDPTRWEGHSYHFPDGSWSPCGIPSRVTDAIGLSMVISRLGVVRNDACCDSWAQLADWTEANVPVTP